MLQPNNKKKNKKLLKRGVTRNRKEANTKLFENLISLDELLALLKNQYRRRTVYSWISQGMPHRKIRGKLWFDKDDALFWLTERS